MADDPIKHRPDDSSVINIQDPEEVRWWCAALGCTPAELEQAVRLMGSDAVLVRRYLNR